MDSLLARIALGAGITAAAVVGLQSGSRTASAPAEGTPATAPAGAARASAPPAATQAAARESRPFSLTLSDADLTKAAEGGFPQTVSGVTVSDPRVHVEGDSVRLVARAKVLIGTTDFVMSATPIVSGGRLTVRVDSATLGGISLPSDTKASIAATVQSTIGRSIPQSVSVTAIRFTPGAITVEGTQP